MNTQNQAGRAGVEAAALSEHGLTADELAFVERFGALDRLGARSWRDSLGAFDAVAEAARLLWLKPEDMGNDVAEAACLFDLPAHAIHADAARIAEWVAQLCAAWASAKAPPEQVLAGLEVFAQRHHVEAPNVGPKSEPPEEKAFKVANRLRSPLWWRRALRKRFRKVEEAAIAAGQVRLGAGATPYASARALARAKADKNRMEDMLACMEVVNQSTGQVLALSDVIESSLANPRHRLAAMAVRIKGAEQYAQTLGMVGLFLTVTCPSRMHSSGDKFDGTTPRQAHAYLCKLWANAMRKTKHAGIQTMGVRVVEPHKDACPHWHVLAFVRPEHADTLTAIVRDYALSDSPDEAGAQEHRFTVEQIDRAKGSAVSYVMKYVSKSIDGAEVDKDNETDLSGPEAARAIVTWARVHNIRQFQFFGLPSVTPVRELYRVEANALPDSVAVREAHQCIKDNEQGALLCVLAMDHLDLSSDYTQRPSSRYPGERVRCLVGVCVAGADLAQAQHVTTRTPGEWVIRLRHDEQTEGLRFPWTRSNNSANPLPEAEPTGERASTTAPQNTPANTPEGAPAGADATAKEAAPCF
jgi:Bacteriophage replication gene A protein (GPA)